MIAAIADTHAVIWYLGGDSRLSDRAREYMNHAAQAGDTIGVSSISLVEVVYLVERKRFEESALERIFEALSNPSAQFVEVPVDMNLVRVLPHVSARQIPDMPDRIIAATAVLHQVPLISRDGKIRVSNVETLW